MNIFYQPLLPRGAEYLDEEESRHCVKVLRKRNGDSIRITDGAGSFYDCVIVDATPSQCRFSISQKISTPPRDYSIHIAIAPTKNADRMEWFVEKATELGVDKITLMNTEHTERVFIKTERLYKVAVSAMKQSLKASLPDISALKDFSAVMEMEEPEKFIAYVDDDNARHLKDLARPGTSYLVLIGPEGDFSKDELSTAVGNGFQKVSLGKSRLRTETAGIAACHILNLINS